MRVEKVRIVNFKRFEHLEMELGTLDCLVGPNNSGKTTLLQALALFDFCLRHCLQRRNGGLELKRRTIAPEDFYVLPVSSPYDLWTDRKAMSGGQQRIIQVCAVFDSGQEATASIKLDFNRFGIGLESTDSSQPWLEQLASCRMAYLPVFSTFLVQEERRTRAVIDDELARGRVHSVIRNLLLDIKEEGRQQQLAEVLQRAFPNLEAMDIQFDEVSDRYISVTYQEAGRAKAFDVYSAGSGFQQFVYLFGFILLREPSVVLLDEPDAHLHGSLQSALLEELRRLVDAGKQVLLATHSRHLIQRISPESILALEETGARRLNLSFDLYDTLDHLGALDPTQLPVIQAYQRVLIVEDDADYDLLGEFCTKCLGAATWHQLSLRLAVCYAKGNPYKQPIERLRDQLQQMITLQGRTLQAFVIADRDYHPEPGQLRAQLPSRHLEWHVWERAEVENYLLCPGAMKRLVRGPSREPTLWETAFQEHYEALLDSSRDRAHDRLVEGYDYLRRESRRNWDAATMSRLAREYLAEHWIAEKPALADAKDVVLPGIKRWLQDQHLGQFSNKSLAKTLLAEELPQEVHDVCRRLARFAGLHAP